MQIVIISGLPCSGKSTLANQLRARWGRPLLCKDEFKELLFDSLGSGDRAWSRRVSAAAYSILFRQAEVLARSNTSCIVEGNFREREHREPLARLPSLGAAVQVHCRAEPQVLISRFRERARLGARHAGHVDLESLPEIESEMIGTPQVPLSIDAQLIDCDTTHDWELAIARAVDRVLMLLV